jgi:hypothetical protein
MTSAVTALSTPPLIATTQVLPAPSRGPTRSGASSVSASVEGDLMAGAGLAHGAALALAGAITMELQSDRY